MACCGISCFPKARILRNVSWSSEKSHGSQDVYKRSNKGHGVLR